MIKKAGIEFRAAVAVDSTLTGLAGTLSGQYRLAGSTDAWTTLGAFAEEKAGFYSTPVTIATPGVYIMSIASSDSRIEDADVYVTVTAASIDDVQTAIANAQADITAMKSQIDVLDEATVNAIASQVSDVDAKLVELKGLLSDTDDAAVVSLRELLLDIQSAGSSRDSIISALTNFTDDLEHMIRGDEFLEDGSANPFYGKTGHDIYDQLVSSVSYLDGVINDAKNAVIVDANTTRDLIVGKVDAIKAVVDANAAELGDAAHGLAALKTMLTTIDSNTAGGTQSIIDMLEDSTNGLEAIKTSIMDKLNIIEGKIDDGLASRARVVL